MSSTLYPKAQAEFATWLNTLANTVAADPEAVGVTQAQSGRLSAANAAFQTVYAASIHPTTRTRPVVAGKYTALAAAKREAKHIADIVRAAPGMRDDTLVRLGFPPRSTRGVSLPPTEQVSLRVISTGPNSIRLRVSQAATANRRKPASSIGAVILYYIGEVAPINTREWTLGELTSKSTCELTLPASIPPGSMVWLAGFYVNRKLQRGPMAGNSVQIRLAGRIGSSIETKDSMTKIAA